MFGFPTNLAKVSQTKKTIAVLNQLNVLATRSSQPPDRATYQNLLILIFYNSTTTTTPI